MVNKRRNELYDLHFEFEKTPDGKVAYCKNCEPMKEIKMKNSNTSGLIKHLQNTHLDIYNDILKDRPIPPCKMKIKREKPKEEYPTTEENVITDRQSPESVFSYSDPLLYNNPQMDDNIPEVKKLKTDKEERFGMEVVKFLIDKHCTQDEAELQGKCWANQYRQLSGEQQIWVKKKIDDILFEARLEGIKNSSSNNSANEPSSSHEVKVMYE